MKKKEKKSEFWEVVGGVFVVIILLLIGGVIVPPIVGWLFHSNQDTNPVTLEQPSVNVCDQIKTFAEIQGITYLGTNGTYFRIYLLLATSTFPQTIYACNSATGQSGQIILLTK